jgi:hypothetical protein
MKHILKISEMGIPWLTSIINPTITMLTMETIFSKLALRVAVSVIAWAWKMQALVGKVCTRQSAVKVCVRYVTRAKLENAYATKRR